MKLRKLALLPAAVAMTFAWAGAASAQTELTLTSVPARTVGPQSTSNPCIIAGTTCQQPAGFGYNNFTQTGAIFDYNMWSTTPTANVADSVQGTPYLVSQLTALSLTGSTSFDVAIDVNTTSAAGETLQSFDVWKVQPGDDLLIAFYDGPTNIGIISNNGNGYADWVLSTVSLAGLLPTDQILFNAVWTNASDGTESFFLLPTNPIPEPETYAMMLAGLGLLGFVARRRRQSLGNVAPA